MSRNLVTILITFLHFFRVSSQNATIESPIIINPSFKCYMATNGNDQNSGDSLNPVATFAGALNKLDQLSSNLSGNVYAEVIVYSGNYSEIFKQPLNRFQIGNKYMHVSIRGKDNVMIDGTNLTVNPGNGLVYLLGSNIYVKNIKVNYSTENGIRFGYNYNGTVINSHDIWVDNVEVNQTAGHGVLFGIGALNANGSSTLIPRAKNFKITNSHILNSVNFNTPQSQWGSALKFWNTSHNQAINNHVHDNSGEGINFDYCDTILVKNNLLHDNYANIYLDKVQYAIIEKNHIYNENKVVSGILMGIEAFTVYVTNHYMKDVYVQNNIIHNTTGINIWQGIYSAIQNGYFDNIQIRYNTVIGKQVANGAQISMSYETALGQPVPNINFNNLRFERNLISANNDSLNNGKLISGPINPQPSLTTEYNLFNINPGFGYNVTTDQINSNIPVFIDPNSDILFELTPCITLNPELIMNSMNICNLLDDYAGNVRANNSNVGALERDDNLQLDLLEKEDWIIFPNPVKDQFKIDIPQAEKLSLKVLSSNGEELIHVSNYSGEFIPVSHIASGFYHVIITSNSSKKNSFIKLIKW
jgi:hypothetical protein